MCGIGLIGIDIKTKILFIFLKFLYVLWIILWFYLRVMNIPDIFLGKHLHIVEPKVFPAPTYLSYVFTSELMLSLWDSRAKPVIGHGSSILQSFPKAFHPNLWEDEWKSVASKQALGGAIKQVCGLWETTMSGPTEESIWFMSHNPFFVSNVYETLHVPLRTHGKQTDRQAHCLHRAGWNADFISRSRDHQKSSSLLILHKCL